MLIKNDKDEFAADPWDRFDRAMGRVRDALAVVGILAVIAALGFSWEKFV